MLQTQTYCSKSTVHINKSAWRHSDYHHHHQVVTQSAENSLNTAATMTALTHAPLGALQPHFHHLTMWRTAAVLKPQSPRLEKQSWYACPAQSGFHTKPQAQHNHSLV